jgi:CheY-like chemotaxis protein
VFSRKESVTPKVLDLNAILSEMDKMLLRLIGEDIEFVTHLEPGLWRAKVDTGQIEQVLMNLVVNARDAMPEGGKIIFETKNVCLDEADGQQHPVAQPGEYVMMVVSDTGIGMTPEIRDRAVEPFFTTKEVGKGTGLGLATVHGIVKQANGDISIHSELGQGTTFRIYFPRVDEPAEAAVHAEVQIPLGGTETILVLEDEATVRDIIRDSLETFGYKVLEAADPQEALDVARVHDDEIQLLLTDVILPGIGGREAAKRMTALRPGIKVLFMSGYTDDAIAHHGVLAPNVAFIQKPFGPMALARKIQEVLSAETANAPIEEGDRDAAARSVVGVV